MTPHRWQIVKPAGSWRQWYAQALAAQPGLPVYNQPWYLDQVAPGRWLLLAALNSAGQPLAALPFAARLLPWPAVYQPLYTQQLAWLGQPPVAVMAQGLHWLSRQYKLGQLALSGTDLIVEEEGEPVSPSGSSASKVLPLQAWVQQLRRWTGGSKAPGPVLHIPDMSDRVGEERSTDSPALPLPSHLSIIPRVNLVLDLAPGYSAVQAGYSPKLKASLKKGTGLNVEPLHDLHALLRLFQQEKAGQASGLKPRHYQRLLGLMQACQQQGAALPLGIYESGQLMAGVFMINWQGRVYNLFAAGSAAARQRGAMPVLLDAVIRTMAGQPCLLDFEGSNIEGVAFFFRSFGAAHEPYSLCQWPAGR